MRNIYEKHTRRFSLLNLHKSNLPSQPSSYVHRDLYAGHAIVTSIPSRTKVCRFPKPSPCHETFEGVTFAKFSLETMSLFITLSQWRRQGGGGKGGANAPPKLFFCPPPPFCPSSKKCISH